MFTPAKSFLRMRFCTLAGVAQAQLVGGEIIGTWNPDLRLLIGLNNNSGPVCTNYPPIGQMPLANLGERMLVEELANWHDDPASILAFVRRFGAFSVPESGKEFRQSIQEWRGYQRQFRKLWWHSSPSDTVPNHPFSDPKAGEEFRKTIEEWKRAPLGGKLRRLPGITASVHEGELITSIEGDLFYIVESLGRFLDFEFALYPTDRFRICARPGCEHPYFTAHHLRQRFCSDLCAQWGQQQWKKQWWKKHGESWRAKRRSKKLKGGKNVTRKTR